MAEVDGRPRPTAVVLLAAPPDRVEAVLCAARSGAPPSADGVCYLGRRLPVEAKKHEADGREIPMERLDHTVVVVIDTSSVQGAQAVASRVLETAGVGGLALVGRLHEVRYGAGPVLGLCVFRWSPSSPDAACLEHWRSTHADLACQFPGGPGYAQLHVEPRAARSDGYDGAALVRYRDLDAMAAGRDDVGYFRCVTDDEKLFLDHSRSSVLVFTAT